MTGKTAGDLQRFALAAALLAGLSLLAGGAAVADEAAPNLKAFQTTDVYGEAVDLEALPEKWVVVNFWATWCKPCRKEIPDFSDLHTRRDDVSLIGLAFEETTADAIRSFLEDYPATYPMALVDVFNPPAAFGTPRVLPTTLLISPEGELRKRFVGPITSADIEAEIAAGNE